MQELALQPLVGTKIGIRQCEPAAKSGTVILDKMLQEKFSRERSKGQKEGKSKKVKRRTYTI